MKEIENVEIQTTKSIITKQKSLNIISKLEEKVVIANNVVM